jgi:hypothetical protein
MKQRVFVITVRDTDLEKMPSRGFIVVEEQKGQFNTEVIKRVDLVDTLDMDNLWNDPVFLQLLVE